MKNTVILLVASAIALPSGALWAQSEFTATLDEGQAVPPTASSATGTATLTLNAAQDTLTYSITLVGVDLDGNQTASPDDDVVAMHFHNAPPGVNGAVVFGLISPNHDTDDLVIDPVAGTLTGAWEDTDTNPLSAQLADLKAGNLYLNVHTEAFSAGEIRGQVEPVSVLEIPAMGVTGAVALVLVLAGLGFVALRRSPA